MFLTSLGKNYFFNNLLEVIIRITSENTNGKKFLTSAGDLRLDQREDF